MHVDPSFSKSTIQLVDKIIYRMGCDTVNLVLLDSISMDAYTIEKIILNHE